MPRFVIPKDIKLLKKADLDMVRCIQRVKKTGKEGASVSGNYRFEETNYALIEFGLLVEREVMAHSGKAALAKFKRYLIHNQKRFAQMGAMVASGKLAGINKLLTSDPRVVCPPYPRLEKRLFVTAAGEKFFRDVKIVLGGE